MNPLIRVDWWDEEGYCATCRRCGEQFLDPKEQVGHECQHPQDGWKEDVERDDRVAGGGL